MMQTLYITAVPCTLHYCFGLGYSNRFIFHRNLFRWRINPFLGQNLSNLEKKYYLVIPKETEKNSWNYNRILQRILPDQLLYKLEILRNQYICLQFWSTMQITHSKQIMHT